MAIITESGLCAEFRNSKVRPQRGSEILTPFLRTCAECPAAEKYHAKRQLSFAQL